VSKEPQLRELISETQIRERVGELAAQIAATCDDGQLTLVTVLDGARRFTQDLAAHLKVRTMFGTIRAGSYGNRTKSTGIVQITQAPSVSVEGSRVIVVEDIVDTGYTVSAVCAELGRRGAISVQVCTLLSKPARRKVNVMIDYCGFEIEDVFVVGYGLDYAGQYRDLSSIRVLDT